MANYRGAVGTMEIGLEDETSKDSSSDQEAVNNPPRQRLLLLVCVRRSVEAPWNVRRLGRFPA